MAVVPVYIVRAIHAADHFVSSTDDRLNLVFIPLFEKSRLQAGEADNKRGRGEQLVLPYGVPVTIEEQYRVAGTQTTLGARKQIGNVYESEDPLVI